MKIYITGYSQRWRGIALTIICMIVAVILSAILFYGKLNKLCSQLDNYASADYSVIYVLNYSANLPNECIFPDTDIQLFLDETKQKRMTVTSVMRANNKVYDLEYLKELNEILPGEIIVSKNVADKYRLQTGSKVYAELPYTASLMEMTVSEIMAINFDHNRPNIDNDIGIVYLGHLEDYEKNVRCKYLEFATESEAEALSNYPQIINTIINKADNINYVLMQGAAPLIFQMLFCIVAVIVGNTVFFSKSMFLLRRCYLKGMKRRQMISIPLFEKMLFGLIPGIIVSKVLLTILPGRSQLRLAYSLLPSIVYGTYCIVMFGIDMMKTRKRGG